MTNRRSMTRNRRAGRGVVVAVAAGILLAGFAGVAAAQDAEVRALTERLQRLERDLRTLERAAYRGESPPPRSDAPSGNVAGTLADAEVRMSRIESELRRLTGRIEEVNHGIEVVSGRLDKLVADVDFRLSELERRVNQQQGGAGPAAGTENGTAGASQQPSGTGQAGAAQPDESDEPRVANTGVLPAGTPMERYNYARSLLSKLDFDGAEQAFRAFIAEHGNDRLAGNAYYWLGETYYSRGRLDDAARVFLDGFQRFPDGAKAPDTLLKLAITLRSMNQTQEACATLGELKKRFPQVTRPIGNRMDQEWREAGCT